VDEESGVETLHPGKTTINLLLEDKPFTELGGRPINYSYEGGTHTLTIQINKTYQIRIPEDMIQLSRTEFQKYLSYPKVSILRTDTDYRILAHTEGDPGKGCELT
jgi:hypothetical protein